MDEEQDAALAAAVAGDFGPDLAKRVAMLRRADQAYAQEEERKRQAARKKPEEPKR